MSQNPSYSRLMVGLNSILTLTTEVEFPPAQEEPLDLEAQIGQIQKVAREALEEEPMIQDIGAGDDRDPLDYRHIDEFLDDVMIQFKHPELKYVNFVLTHARKSASERGMHNPWMRQFQLFADYEGKTYQVTGASRLGDVFLSEDFKIDAQWSERVPADFRKFSNWRDKGNWRLSFDERLVLAKAAGCGGEPKRHMKVKEYLDNWMRSNSIPEWYSDATPEQRTTLRDAKRTAAKEAEQRARDNY